MHDHSKIKEIASLLKKSKNILFITGSGISADSGLPTYRGIGGLYESDDTEDGMSIEDALSGEMLRTRPEITWKYLSQIEKRCREASYNKAHKVLAEMEGHFERVWVLTQNIDGFHQAAGSKNVIDVHGDMHDIVCTSCDWTKRVADYNGLKIPPLCPNCGTIARPGVVFFGEMLQPDKVRIMDRELSQIFDVYFSIGTTSVFPYIRGPMVMAEHLGKPTIEINPGRTDISDIADIKLPMRASEALEAIWAECVE
jgi:NAD-dependent deacetylase